MKIKASQLSDNVNFAGSKVFGFLFFGSDFGASMDFAQKTIAAIKTKQKNCEVQTILPEQIKEDAGVLRNEVASVSLFSASKIIWLKSPPDSFVGELEWYFEYDALQKPVLIVSSDSFNTKSKTVALFNDEKNAVALASYLQEAADLRQTITDVIRQNGYVLQADALSFLQESLGADKGATLSELDKLMLYKGNEDKQITLQDAKACFAGSAPASMDELLMAALTGQAMLAQKKLTLLLQDGTTVVAILRSFLGKVNQLIRVQGYIAEGFSADEAIKKVPPFISFKQLPQWKQVVLSWSTKAAVEALKMTIEAEKNTRSNLPDVLILRRYVASMTQAGKKFCAPVKRYY